MRNKIITTLLLLGVTAMTAEASFSNKQIDDMIKKLNYQEIEKVNTDIKDPFGYPEKVIKTIKMKKPKPKIKKRKKIEKKIIIDYQGLIINKALINNKTYEVGQKFNDAEIVKITPTQLFLKQNDFIFEIKKDTPKIIIKEKK